ncbi:hypothetical protein [Rubidibacter lacunae]|nr:hypothetical protein [Rubidibacter lacunae]
MGTIGVDTALGLPTVKSIALGANRNLPWSEPAQIDDPFEGSFVGVFDRHIFFGRFLNTSARIEIQSLWGPESIRVLSIVRDRNCLSHSVRGFCSDFTNARNIITLLMKIDGEIFEVTGQNSQFPVTPELATTLQTTPEEEIAIRLITDSGEVIDSELGKDTVRAWKTVYGSL